MQTFVKEENDLIVIGVDGILTFDDLQEMQNTQREKIRRDKKVKVLVLAEKFTGWGKEGDWGDLTFMYKIDPYIEILLLYHLVTSGINSRSRRTISPNF